MAESETFVPDRSPEYLIRQTVARIEEWPTDKKHYYIDVLSGLDFTDASTLVDEFDTDVIK
jgi:hypothetical protein